MQKIDGYFPLYWDERTGNLWLEIPRFDTDFLYTTGLAAGLGSNDIGLDRGSKAAGQVVSFQRVGPRVLLVQGNDPSAPPAPTRPSGGRWKTPSRSRCSGASRWRRRATATCWWTPRDFFLRDGHGAGRRCGPARIAWIARAAPFYHGAHQSFPKNTEIEVTLTFANEAAGGRGGGGGGAPAQGPPQIVVTARRAGARRGRRRGASAADCSPAPSPA